MCLQYVAKFVLHLERHIIHPVAGQHTRPGHPAGRMGSICVTMVSQGLFRSSDNIINPDEGQFPDPVAPPAGWGGIL